MGDLFDIGKAGISAYKNSLAATGQNIANVGTEGYSRRDASIEEISSAKADVLSLSNSAGLGVRMGGITRAFDQFLDLQLQNSSSSFSFAKSKAEVLDQLEGVLIPKNATVSTRISEFFDSLSDLAQDPSDVNLRTLAISGAKSVSREFSSLYSGLSDLRTMVHGTLELAASEFNSTLKNLSKVQNEIMGNSNKSGAPNILLDQRDKLLSKLSELAEISVDYDKSPSVSVTLGQLGNSGVLLQGNSYNQISFETGANGVSAYLKDPAGGLSGIHFSSGQLAGLVSADTLVGVTSAEVNSLATKFVQEINDIHKMGIDLNGERGGDLFTLEAVGVTKSPKNLGTSSLRIEGYSGDLSGSTLDIVFSSARSSWGVTSSDNKAIENFNSTLKLNGMTISVQGEPKDGDKFSIEMSDTTAANMSLLISDINKLAAAGLHTVQVDTKNSGSADLDISYFQEKLAPGALNLESLFSEARNAANPIKFNAAGVLGVIQGVESLEEVSVLNSQSNLRISTSLTNLSASDNVTVNLVNLGTSANETFVFNISDVLVPSTN